MAATIVGCNASPGIHLPVPADTKKLTDGLHATASWTTSVWGPLCIGAADG